VSVHVCRDKRVLLRVRALACVCGGGLTCHVVVNSGVSYLPHAEALLLLEYIVQELDAILWQGGGGDHPEVSRQVHGSVAV
jgi:ferredoxin